MISIVYLSLSLSFPLSFVSFCCFSQFPQFSLDSPNFYRPQGEGNIFIGVCLSTIGLMATRSLLILVTGMLSCAEFFYFCNVCDVTNRFHSVHRGGLPQWAEPLWADTPLFHRADTPPAVTA